jgi:hypothetical protein
MDQVGIEVEEFDNEPVDDDVDREDLGDAEWEVQYDDLPEAND